MRSRDELMRSREELVRILHKMPTSALERGLASFLDWFRNCGNNCTCFLGCAVGGDRPRYEMLEEQAMFLFGLTSAEVKILTSAFDTRPEELLAAVERVLDSRGAITYV